LNAGKIEVERAVEPEVNETFGKYKLIKKLPSGMAEVFLAEQELFEGISRKVVIKRLPPTFPSEFRQMFLDEAKIMSSLSNPYIVQIYDFGVENKIYYLAMEFVDGVDMRTLYRAFSEQNKFIPYQYIALIAHQVCLGLHSIHTKCDSRGKPLEIVHRDITPQNIMVSSDGIAKILDFGIARAKERFTETSAGQIKGKFAYMSPEQPKHKSLDARSDIFSLGVVLWELLTNKRLFKRDNYAATMQAVLNAPILPVTKFNPQVPKPLEKIVMKALERNPKSRYQSAKQMAEDLEQFKSVPDHKVTQEKLGEFVKRVKVGDKDVYIEQTHPSVPSVSFISRITGSFKERPWMWASALALSLVLTLAVIAAVKLPSVKALFRELSIETVKKADEKIVQPIQPEQPLKEEQPEIPEEPLPSTADQPPHAAAEEKNTPPTKVGEEPTETKTPREEAIVLDEVIEGSKMKNGEKTSSSGAAPPAPPKAPAKPPPPPPPPRKVRFEITSSPPGVTVFVDSVPKGKTPLATSIAIGSHIVNFYSPQYGIDEPVNVIAQRNGSVALRGGGALPNNRLYKEFRGRVNIAVIPDGKIIIRGPGTDKEEQTPCSTELLVGEYEVLASLEGYKPKRTTVVVKYNQTKPVPIKLEPESEK